MYSGINGFLPWRASIMLDVVFVAMFAVLPALAYSVWLVKHRRNYALHKRMQLTLAGVLLVAVGFFEIDMQFMTDWRLRAAESPYFDAKNDSGPVIYALWVHLFFAVSTAALWVYVVFAALRKFPVPPQPGEHSHGHVFWARLAAWDMALTAVTGWVFYYLAFVA